MTVYFVDVLLFSIAAVLALTAATRGRTVLRESAREGVFDFFKLVPRIMLGVIGAGYVAALLRRTWSAAGSARIPARRGSRLP